MPSPLEAAGPLAAPFARASIAVRERPPIAPRLERTPSQRALVELDARLRDLRAALERLREDGAVVAAGPRRAARPAAEALAVSSSALDLEPVPTFTTLRSREEVNAIPTSFSPFGPDVQGTTTALPTVGGVYDGSQGDDTLTFEIRNNRIVGEPRSIGVDVFDGAGNRIDRLDFEGLAPDTPVALSNGLTLSFSAGLLARRDTFEVQVFTSVGSAVDPTRPFDGTRNDIPNFEPGFAVVGGSFEVNGVAIAVSAGDTIESVLDAITASEAGVTATFDAASERVVLTQKTAGSLPDVVLGADTSGFLAATKLEGAVAVPGQDGSNPVEEPIANVPALASVSDGTFHVNGVAIAVDTATDSLGDVLDRINQSAAGVRATLDPETLRVTIASDDPKAPLVLDDGTSGFLSAVLIEPGTYRAREARDARGGPGLRDVAALRRDLQQLRHALDAALARDTASRDGRVAGAQAQLRTAIESVFQGVLGKEPDATLRSGFGLDFRFDAEPGRTVTFDGDRFERALARDLDAAHGFFFAEGGGGDAPGLVASLLEHLDALQEGVAAQLGTPEARGRLIDVLA